MIAGTCLKDEFRVYYTQYLRTALDKVLVKVLKKYETEKKWKKINKTDTKM